MNEINYELKMLKVPVKDVAVSSKFYVGQLGFKELFVAAQYGWAQMAAGDISIALYQPGMGGGNGHIGGSVDFHLGLNGEAFDTVAHRLLDAGHLEENMIHTGNDGSTFIDVRDPDGNLVKIVKC